MKASKNWQGFLFGQIAKRDLKVFPNRGKYKGEWKLFRGKKDLQISTKSSFIRIKKRNYPRTFASQSFLKTIIGYSESGNVNLAAGSIRLPQDSEYLLIEINHKKGFVQIQTDTFATVPLYYLETRNELYFSTDFIDLLKFVPRPVEFNLPVIVEYLLLQSRYNDQTFLSEIKLLTERSKLKWSRFGLKVEYPSSLTLPCPSGKGQELREEFLIAKFERLLSRVIRKKLRQIKSGGFGSELSGGLDSSVITQVLIKYGAKDLEAFSLILPDKQRVKQRQRLFKFKKRFSCALNFVETKNRYPLKDAIRKLPVRFDLRREPYYEATACLAEKAKEKSVSVMFTGFGGDELFQIDPAEEMGFQGEIECQRRRRTRIPGFFKPKLKRIFLNKESIFRPFPIPLLPASDLHSNIANSNLYLKKGIWCISPFFDIDLTKFCRSLPVDFSTKRNLLRLYQKKHNFPKEITSMRNKDSFIPLYEIGVREKGKDLLIRLFKTSYLAKMDLLDPKKLLRAYKEYVAAGRKQYRDYFYGIAAMEIFLRTF